jgi:hypothetical protein
MPGFLHDNMSVYELFDGVAQYLPPTGSELRKCDEIAAEIAAETGSPAQNLEPELFLLKIGVTAQYAMGLLETLGMEAAGISQFYQVFELRLAENFRSFFKTTGPQAAALLKRRLQEYETALHTSHAENPHLAVADYFTRFAGAPDDARLVSLCLEVCKDLSDAFLKEIALVKESLHREKHVRDQK